METTVGTSSRMRDSLISLRRKASELISQSEDEELLAEVVAMFRGMKLPCTYTKEEFAEVLNEADADYKAGKFVAQEELRSRYGL